MCQKERKEHRHTSKAKENEGLIRVSLPPNLYRHTFGHFGKKRIDFGEILEEGELKRIFECPTRYKKWHNIEIQLRRASMSE